MFMDFYERYSFISFILLLLFFLISSVTATFLNYAYNISRTLLASYFMSGYTKVDSIYCKWS